MGQANKQIDREMFRSVLGNYPTGVAVVTGMSASGEPLGMVVGSFTSVSLTPPLVAFLPMKTSRSFNALREGSDRFCINILAADQEGACRVLAAPGENKFANIPWRKSPAGNPIIDGVVGWIDCEYANIFDGGDHHIVVGAVQSMEVGRDSLPLLFFQRGYGRFSSGSLLVATERSVMQSIRMAEAARAQIETLAEELDMGCSVIAAAGGESIYVAVSDYIATKGGKNRLGARAPLVPPLGALFVDSPNALSEEQWLAGLGKCDDEVIAKAREQLARVRRRGWSISLLGALSPRALDEAIEAYSCPHRTPEQARRFLSTASAMFDMHEPVNIEDNQQYDLLHLTVPVKQADGTTVLALRLSEMPSALTGVDIARLVERLKATATEIEALIGRIPH